MSSRPAVLRYPEPSRGALLRLVACALAAAPLGALAQLPGENVNMVSGTTWPGGDPFLQRQNEPSIAVSSANPLHLLAGANDYRSVDLSVAVTKMAGDAWLGVFKSFDGGQTWRSTLMPGHPLDGSPEGLASPLRGFTAAADPTVRAGPAGMLYYSGIAFNRGSNLGRVVVTRFFDRNDKENGDATLGLDPIQYLGGTVIDSGTSGQFLDKPWLAVDAPRPGDGTCALPGTGGRTVPAGAVYLLWAAFTGANEQSSKIMFTRSLDCGATWANPQKLSESNSLNQGTTVAVDPVSGAVHVAWRRYATSSQTDAVLYARSTDRGQTFTKATVVADIPFNFDQGLSTTRFRSEGMPTMAVSVDAAGTRSWVHLAWAQRATAGGDGRVVLSTSDGGAAWSAPAPVDDGPIADDFGNAFTRGHQLMPALSFSQGRLMVLYYDSRLSHTRSFYRPNFPFAPDARGRFYEEYAAPRGERISNPSLVHGPDLDDAPFTEIRHTLDVRVAQAGPGPAPVFSSTRVSQYRFGSRGDELPGQQVPGYAGPLQVADAAGNLLLLQQLQVNPPNLPLFRQGTVPFMGDYIDLAGKAFEPTAGGGWAFATAPSPAPVHYAVWTTNQDVRPPADGDWTHYTPVGPAGPSQYDPTVTRPACLPGQEGMRNQNIYSSRITDGLLVSSPQNVKPLSSTLVRAFSVAVANTTDKAVAVRLAVAAPDGVAASFRSTGAPLGAFDVVIPRRSSIARSVFVRLAGATDPAATLQVTAAQVAGDASCLGALPPTCPLVTGGLSGAVTLNPPGAVPVLRQPDGSSVDVATLEVYPPTASSANVSSANVSSTSLNGAANVSSANVSSANVSSANVSSANVSSTHISNPDLANVSSANVSSANVSSANVSSANVSSANVSSANVTSAAISDATYSVSNAGNTAHTYHVRIVGTAPAGTPLQLILSRPYTTPISIGCTLYEEPRARVVTSVDDVSGAIVPPGGLVADPNTADPRASNATFTLAPGEVMQVTLRGPLQPAQLAELTTRLAPVVVPHAGGGYAAPLLVTSDGATLPVPQVGVPYAATLTALGGTAPYTWSLAPGSGPLPGGLALSPSGALSGTPTTAGTSTFTVQVGDSAATPGAAPRTLTLTVARGPASVTLAATPSPSVAFQPVTLTATVAAASAGPGVPVPGGTVTFLDGATALGAAPLQDGIARLTVSTLAVGGHALGASHPGDDAYLGASAAAITHAVAAGATTIGLATSPALPVFGQPLTLTATVARTPDFPGAPAPGGTVTFFDGPEPIGQVALATGQASLLVDGLSVGGHVFTASYGGDAASVAATSGGQPVVVDLAPTLTALAAAPSPSLVGQPVVLTAAVTVPPPGAGAVSGTVTFLDGTAVLGTAPASGGQATVTTAALAAGTHALTARYGGGGGLAQSTSATVGQVVTLGTTAVSLVASPALPVHGQPVSLAATVARTQTWPGAPTPGGTVTFFDGPEPIGQVALAAGQASLLVGGLPVGGHVFTAAYGGDATSAAATSTGQPLVVDLAATATALSSSPNPSAAGQAVTFTATVAVVAPGAGAVGGGVTFLDGTTVLGTVAISGGAASLTTAALGVGTHAVTARYGGGGGLAGSTSAALGQVVRSPFYAFTGFLSPLASAGTLASPTVSPSQNFGSAVPVKWQLKDAGGALVTRLTSTTLLKAVLNTACKGPAPAGAKEVVLYSPTAGAAGGSTFRFSTDQFVFNWDTSKGASKGCWEIVLTLDDGSAPRATIVQLR